MPGFEGDPEFFHSENNAERERQEFLKRRREREASEAKANGGRVPHNEDKVPGPQPNGGNPGQAPESRPTIRITAGELAQVVDEVDIALATAGRNLFAYGNKLVQIVMGEIRTTQGKEKSLRLHLIAPHGLLCQISMAAVFERYNSKIKEWVTVDCPIQVAQAYLERGQWRVRTLLGIVTCPTLRPDGSVLSTPGYDEQTGLFFEPGNATFPPTPERPTKDQALAALEVLKAPIAKFKFINAQSRSVALSGFITAVIRRALDTAPMHAADAPVAGSGKSLLGDVASIIVTGHRAAVYGAREMEELEKKLSGALIAGDAFIMLDNMITPVGGQLLCQMLTQEKVKPRPFGKLENVEVPSNAMIFCNGNNLVIEGDANRRTLVGRINPEVERPELREFDFHPVQMAKERRSLLVSAALTIVRAGIVARDKPKIVKLGSFERWSELVREPLIWLGEADPVIVMEDVRRSDPELQTLRAMMEAWLQTVGTVTEKSCQALAEIAQARNPYSHELDNPELHAACSAIAHDRTGGIDLHRLGFWFRKNKDRILALADGEYRFAKSSKNTAGLTWWKLEKVAAPALGGG